MPNGKIKKKIRQREMICFDKLKLITNVKYISNLNKIKFEETIKNGEIIYRKYKQMTPYYICIIVNYTNQELSIEFTGKVLLDDYVNLINMNNISECLDRINQLDICVLDVDNILQNAEVTKCDITKDVTSNKLTEIISFIKQNITSYKKWIVKEYKDGISIENTVTTPRYKKRIILYQKIKELVKAGNKQFLDSLADKMKLLEYYEDKIRFELNINTMKQIRDMLGIPGNSLNMVLNAQKNPILDVITEAVAFSNSPIVYNAKSLKDYERELVLKDCNYDLIKVEAKVRSLLSVNTSVQKTMKPYRKLYSIIKQTVSFEDVNIVKMLSE